MEEPPMPTQVRALIQNLAAVEEEVEMIPTTINMVAVLYLGQEAAAEDLTVLE